MLLISHRVWEKGRFRITILLLSFDTTCRTQRIWVVDFDDLLIIISDDIIWWQIATMPLHILIHLLLIVKIVRNFIFSLFFGRVTSLWLLCVWTFNLLFYLFNFLCLFRLSHRFLPFPRFRNLLFLFVFLFWRVSLSFRERRIMTMRSLMRLLLLLFDRLLTMWSTFFGMSFRLTLCGCFMAFWSRFKRFLPLRSFLLRLLVNRLFAFFTRIRLWNRRFRPSFCPFLLCFRLLGCFRGRVSFSVTFLFWWHWFKRLRSAMLLFLVFFEIAWVKHDRLRHLVKNLFGVLNSFPTSQPFNVLFESGILMMLPLQLFELFQILLTLRKSTTLGVALLCNRFRFAGLRRTPSFPCLFGRFRRFRSFCTFFTPWLSRVRTFFGQCTRYFFRSFFHIWLLICLSLTLLGAFERLLRRLFVLRCCRATLRNLNIFRQFFFCLLCLFALRNNFILNNLFCLINTVFLLFFLFFHRSMRCRMSTHRTFLSLFRPPVCSFKGHFPTSTRSSVDLFLTDHGWSWLSEGTAIFLII